MQAVGVYRATANCAMEAKSLSDKTAKLLGARVQTRSMELVLLPMALQVWSTLVQSTLDMLL